MHRVRYTRIVYVQHLRDGKGRIATVADIIRLPAARRFHALVRVIGDRDDAHGKLRGRVPSLPVANDLQARWPRHRQRRTLDQY